MFEIFELCLQWWLSTISMKEKLHDQHCGIDDVEVWGGAI